MTGPLPQGLTNSIAGMNNMLTETERQLTFSVVVPVYNSSESLPLLLQRVKKVFRELEVPGYEVIFVDDASPNEATWPTLLGMQDSDTHILVIRLMKNSGQHNATLCGLRHADGNLVFTMDDDLQHLPEEMPRLIRHILDSPRCDAVLACPRQREHAAGRNLGSYVANRLVRWAIQAPAGLTFSSYRLLRRDLVSALRLYNGGLVTIGALICQITDHVENAEVEHATRKFGESGYSAMKLISLALANVFNFSDLPLKLVSAVGFLSSTFALCYGLWVLSLTLLGVAILPGFPTVVLLVSFYSGLILFSFGIVGQYLIRILRGVTGGTQYQIRQSIGRGGVATAPQTAAGN